MKKYSYQVPERKVGEIFTYNGERYQVMDGKEQPLVNSEIGCTIRDPETGNIKNLCAFSDHCGRISRLHRGYCVPYERKDERIVYFKKL